MADKFDLAYLGTDELPVSDALGGTDRVAVIDATTGAVSYVALSDLSTYCTTGGTGPFTITSTSANALAVGANGTTNPVLKVNANTASVATGVSVTGAAAAGGVAVAAISSGTDEGLKIDAKGAGVVTIAGTSTGGVAMGSNATDRVTMKGFYMSPANVSVTVPAITDPDIAKVDVDVSGAFSMQPAAGDAVIAIPTGSLEANCRLLGAYVLSTDTIRITFGSEGGNVTGGGVNFKFLVIDLT